MGKGRFIGTGLDLYVSVDFDASTSQNQIEDIFNRLSTKFYQATDGNLHIENIFWVDGGAGRNIADAFCIADANNGVLGQAMLEGIGVYGAWMEVFGFSGFNQNRNDELAFAFMHELGHYLWELGDEYAGPMLDGPMDLPSQQAYDQTTTDYRRVYLSPDFDYTNPVTNQPYDLQDCEVFVYLNGAWVQRIVNAYQLLAGGVVELRVDFGAPFPAAPSTSGQDVRVRPFGLCGYQGQDFCVMNGRGGDVGRREFCGDANHDPGKLTAQSARHDGQPCWQTISEKMGNRWLVTVTPPSEGDPDTAAAPAPNITQLVNEHRYVLVLDRSGSMDEDDKIEGARGGLEYWIDSALAQEEFLGIVWFNSTIEPVQQVENVANIPNIEAVKDTVLGLQPEGSTNIRGALDQAADMLIATAQVRGPAMVQYIVLMTDGVHNVPPPSSIALDAVPKCQENGIQIFTLGLGGPENIDTTVLEELAYQTSGRPNMGAIGAVGQNQDNLVFQALFTLKNELRGIVAAQADLNFDELVAKTAFDQQMRKWAESRDRPSLSDIMEAAGAGSLDELLKMKGRFASTSMWVERGAQRASFGLTFPRKQPVWLYLIDPQGTALNSDAVHIVRGRYPYEAAFVKDPKPGRWIVLAVRQTTGPAQAAAFTGSIVNEALVVAGDCDKVVPLGASASIRANAHWHGDLSGLQVRAHLRDPQGGQHTVVLSDETAADPFSGNYRGVFTPTMPGRHEGEICFVGKGTLQLGDGIDRLSHMHLDEKVREKGTSLDLKLDRDRFRRSIRIYFDAGTRPTAKDRESATGVLGKERARIRRTGLKIPQDAVKVSR